MIDISKIEKATGSIAKRSNNGVWNFYLGDFKTPIEYKEDFEINMSIVHGKDMSQHFINTLINGIENCKIVFKHRIK